MGRKISVQYGRVVSFHLSSEAVAKLAKLSCGMNKSAYMNKLILEEYNKNNPEAVAHREIKEVLDGTS